MVTRHGFTLKKYIGLWRKPVLIQEGQLIIRLPFCLFRKIDVTRYKFTYYNKYGTLPLSHKIQIMSIFLWQVLINTLIRSQARSN